MCEYVNIVLNGTERMIETACDLVGLQPLEVEADGLDAVSLPGADILLLAAAGDLDTALPEDIDIAHDGPDTAIEQAEREVLVTEQAVLVAGLGSHARMRAAKAVDAVLGADLEVLLGVVEGQSDCHLLALVQGLASGLRRVDHQELDLAQSELVGGVVGIESEDVFNDVQDGLGDKGRAVGSLFDATPERTVEGLGVKPALTQLCFDELGSQHECHLRRETPACTLG